MKIEEVCSLQYWYLLIRLLDVITQIKAIMNICSMKTSDFVEARRF